MDIKRDIIESQTLRSHALFFDPVEKDLVLDTDEKGRPMGRYVPKPTGVQVLENGDVVFRYYAPNAKSVQVAGIGGTMGTRRYDLSPRGDGFWEGTVSGIGPGFHYHDYYVDGNRACSDLAPYGYGCFRVLNYFEMPDIYSDFYLLQDVPHGTIRMDYYKSSVTGRMRNCFVYTPPGYEEHPEKRYPVWYLQHGGGEDETGWIWQGKIHYILDNLLASGQCEEMIVVMNCGYAFFPDGSGHHSRGQIGDVLVKDCIPFIDKKYRTLPHRRARAMAGLSMGGFQSQSTVFQYPEYFASVGLFSSNFIVKNEEDDYTELLSDPKAFNELFDLCFVSWGDQEDMKASNGPLLSGLRKKGFRIVSYVTPGYHEWAVWRYSAREFAKLVFRK